MGKRNRGRRAAKLKDRRRAAGQREHASSFSTWASGDERADLQAILEEALRSAAAEHARGDAGAPYACARHLVAELGALGRELDLAADRVVEAAVARAWTVGWSPGDVHEFARRRLDPPLVELLCAAVVAESRRYARAALHPAWRAMLAALPGEGEPASGAARAQRWAERYGHSRAGSLAAAVEVAALLLTLPGLEPLLPRPGEARFADVEPARGAVDQRALARVRALLAKAESTEFPEEAEALSAKAQELMSRYSLHHALLEHERGGSPVALGRRLWLDAPYANAKALLAQAVAAANRCRAVWTEHLGFVTIVGAEADLAGVELLTTSLLMQANRAMLAAGRHVSRSGTSRTRSFRQSFLIAYASRIGERLTAANAAGVAEVGADERLLPVLAARGRAAEELTERLFPRLVTRSYQVSNAAGWGAGRAAADLAQLHARNAVEGGRSAG